MSQANFLIGRGELLTHDIKAPKRGGGASSVYTFDESLNRLAPQLKTISKQLDELPSEACPGDFGVARLAMNPSFIAKSYFPKSFLRSARLNTLGSKTVFLKPNKWSKQKETEICSTTEFFIAGKRDFFRQIDSWMYELPETSNEAVDLNRIESFTEFGVENKLAQSLDESNGFFEVVLHMHPEEGSASQQRLFLDYADNFNIKVHSDIGFHAGSLWFVPIEGDLDEIGKLANYVFVRLIRAMPAIRGIRPIEKRGLSLGCDLPHEQPLSSEPRVAVLDGGLPEKHTIEPWLGKYRKLDESADDDSEANSHGLGVASALLFGSIIPGELAKRPYSYIDSLRVLDKKTSGDDPLELYRTLGLVEEVLLSRQYEFINLSLGPDLPVEDTDVHVWTSVIDELLSDGDTFMTVAVGNNGELDDASGNSRIQVPADSVNSLAIGAANKPENEWQRASYSAIGPGRSPGVVKPDLMAFGGSPSSYFHVLTSGESPELVPTLGTSFSSPYLLRSAVGVRAILGDGLSPLAIKALLIHGSDTLDHHKVEVGWGKVPEDLMEVITCPAGVARVVYQGELKPGKYLRASLPTPEGPLLGNVTLKATFCYASPVDPQDAATYTKAGLDIVFRPNDENVQEGKDNPETKTFFDRKKYATEDELRSDAGKWETVLHAKKNMRGSSLNGPVFDIHYNAREGAAPTTNAEKIRYALIITLEAPRHADLYNDILRTYENILLPIEPKISLPIRV